MTARVKRKSITELFSEIENTPIAKAVAPLREAAEAEAEVRAKKTIAWVTEELAKAGNDLQVAAPYPHGSYTMSKVEYNAKLDRHNLFCRLTQTREGVRLTRNDPRFADMSEERCIRFIQQARECAAEAYRSYVYKLVMKIGEATEARLEGNSVWSFSVLHVSKPDGSSEKWKTQQIWNVSCLGKDFPQWPTRKMK